MIGTVLTAEQVAAISRNFQECLHQHGNGTQISEDTNSQCICVCAQCAIWRAVVSLAVSHETLRHRLIASTRRDLERT